MGAMTTTAGGENVIRAGVTVQPVINVAMQINAREGFKKLLI